MTKYSNRLRSEMSGGTGTTNPQDKEGQTPSIQELSKSKKTRSKAGRPKTIHRKITKASQEGLPANWTRATFIMREDLLKELKNYASAEGETIRDVINEAVEVYLQDREILERGEE